MAKREPLRMCVVCRSMKPKSELFRVTTTEDGPQWDRTGRAQGRGAYLCREASCLDKAQKQKSLERHIKKPIPLELYNVLQNELATGVNQDNQDGRSAEGRRIYKLTEEQRNRLKDQCPQELIKKPTETRHES